MQVSDSDSYPRLASANTALVLLFCTYVLSFVDRQILALMVGPIREAFRISDFQFSILHGAGFAIMYAVAGLPLGRLADKFSRVRIISGSVLFWSVATCLCGFAKNVPQLLATRMTVGIGEAGFAPAAYSIISDSYNSRRLGYAMAFLKSGVYVGSAAALMLGGVLMDYYTSLGPIRWPIIGVVHPWQATFITVGLPGLALALMVWLLEEPSRKGIAEISSGSTGVSLALVLKFLWRRKRTYLSLFVGSSMLAMAAYGSSAWYPEFFIRTYGVSRAEAGSSFGALLFFGGMLGIMLGPWVAGLIAKRHTDYYLRTILYATITATAPAIVAPLAGSKTATLMLLFPAIVSGSVYLGIMAASFQPITPNQMRGFTTALYIFLTNIIGLTAGTSVMAAFTDFIYRDDAKLHYSIASANAVFYPLAIVLFSYGLKGYRSSMTEAGNWKID